MVEVLFPDWSHAITEEVQKFVIELMIYRKQSDNIL